MKCLACLSVSSWPNRTVLSTQGRPGYKGEKVLYGSSRRAYWRSLHVAKVGLPQTWTIYKIPVLFLPNQVKWYATTHNPKSFGNTTTFSSLCPHLCLMSSLSAAIFNQFTFKGIFRQISPSYVIIIRSLITKHSSLSWKFHSKTQNLFSKMMVKVCSQDFTKACFNFSQGERGECGTPGIKGDRVCCPFVALPLFRLCSLINSKLNYYAITDCNTATVGWKYPVWSTQMMSFIFYSRVLKVQWAWEEIEGYRWIILSVIWSRYATRLSKTAR